MDLLNLGDNTKKKLYNLLEHFERKETIASFRFKMTLHLHAKRAFDIWVWIEYILWWYYNKGYAHLSPALSFFCHGDKTNKLNKNISLNRHNSRKIIASAIEFITTNQTDCLKVLQVSHLNHHSLLLWHWTLKHWHGTGHRLFPLHSLCLPHPCPCFRRISRPLTWGLYRYFLTVLHCLLRSGVTPTWG